MSIFLSASARKTGEKKPEIRLWPLGACLLLSCFLSLPAAHAADTGIYERMLEITRQELRVNSRWESAPEASILEAVKRQLPYVENPDAVDNLDVAKLLEDNTVLCDRHDINFFSQCPVVSDVARTLVERETKLRTLGRDLQIIASSFEEPVLGGFALPFTSRLQGVARLWRADLADPNAPEGGEDVENAGLARIRVEEPPAGDDLQGLLRELSGKLEALVVVQEFPAPEEGTEPAAPQRDITELSAAVWRYRFAGVKWLNGRRRDLPQPSGDVVTPADGTERELLRRRWPEIERVLEDIAGALIVQAETLEVAPGEAVLFSLPVHLRDILPDNVDLAAYAERTQAGELTGDAGLRWVRALEPVQVTLCSGSQGSCTPVPGGHYPPAQSPEDVSPFCTSPAMRPGLLCSEHPTERAGVCAEEVEEAPDTIQLAACTGTEPLRRTEPGGDVCAMATWLPQTDVPGQKECHVEFRCGGIENDASTSKKEPGTDTVTITLSEDPLLAPAHIALMQLAHARQACNAPAGSDPFEQGATAQERRTVCCRIEGDAHRAACQAMAEDGVFKGSAFTPGGIPINAETCADVLTDEWCRIHEFGSCPGTFSEPLPDEEVMEAADGIRAHAAQWLEWRNAGAAPEDRVAETCAELLDPEPPLQRDPRIDAAVHAIEHSTGGACAPMNERTMANTVGNLMCYLNRCWAESMGQNRLIPGRTPVTNGGDAYPFDVCMLPDPGLGKIIPTISPEADEASAPYRPALLLRHLEESLCPGLPLGSPLCTFDVSRRIDLPLNSLTQFAGDIAGQTDEFQQPGIAMRQLSEALGMRIGTRMYGEFLRRRSQALTDFTTAAAALLSQFPRARFPDTLCPMTDGGLLGTDACGLSMTSSSSSRRSSSSSSSRDSSHSSSTQSGSSDSSSMTSVSSASSVPSASSVSSGPSASSESSSDDGIATGSSSSAFSIPVFFSSASSSSASPDGDSWTVDPGFFDALTPLLP